MSDDTTRSDNWNTSEPSGGTPPSEGNRVSFCQDCGKPLTAATARTVGTGVFCEPCLTARVGATTQASGYATVPPYTNVPPPPSVTTDPSPAMAAILGFIPGVGAMYNGQFAKGIVHLAIFAILTSVANNVNGIFGLFVAGWIFYMVFEAYHTAIARRDGLPLPNAFGFNDIGERMGFGRSWGTMGSARPAGPDPAQPAPPPPPPAAGPVPPSSYVPFTSPPVGTAPDWIGYVPPTAFGGTPPFAPAAAAQPTPPWEHAPYAETYTGYQQPPYGNYVPPVTELPTEVETRRFPTGAFWLIGLGVVILAANLLPDWRFTGRWWPPVLFAGLAAWTFSRRLRSGARLACIIRWPVILMVLALMSALHAAYFAITFGLIVSVLLIVLGGLLLMERTIGSCGPSPAAAAAAYAGPPTSVPPPVESVPPPVEDVHSRAAWDTAGHESPSTYPESPKGEK